MAVTSAAREHALIRYQSLIDATSVAVWSTDASGRTLRDSPSFRKITGESEEDYLAGGRFAAVHPDDRAAAEQAWAAAVAAGRVYHHECRMRTTTGEYRHFRARAVPVVVAGRVAEWIGTETDIEVEVRARTRLELLAKATEAVNREDEPERGLQALAEVLVPAFADGCLVHLIDPVVPGGPVTGQRLITRVDLEVPADATSAEAFSYVGEHPFVELCRTGRSALLEHPLHADARWAREADLARWERELRWHTTLLAPILSGGTVVAALTFIAWGDRRRYTDEDLTFVAELTSRASAAVEQAQRFQETRRAALTLQQAMLTRPPARPDVTVEARYQPAHHDFEVGGDWYDAFSLPGGDLGLVVGDVVGHDLEAAAVMGQLRSMFRGIAMDDGFAPDAAVARLDELAVALGITDFTTLLYGRLSAQAAGAVFRWCSAGHVPPLLVGPDGRCRLLTDGAGLLLGVDPGTLRRSGETRLAPGSTLLLYTDGLVERRRHALDDGIAELAGLAGRLANLPLAQFCDELVASSSPDTGDDVVVLAVRLPGGLAAA